nr:MAG TPA: hypothetical protein [Caudoviricetes sp.]
MFVVTKSGHKLPVDDSSIDKDEYVPLNDVVGIYDDDTTLNKIWILTLEKSNYIESHRFSNYELEFVKELRYDHMPSKEEILWAMSAYGLTHYDTASIREAYELGTNYD